MAAGVKDIVVEQGASFRMSLTWKQSDGTPHQLDGAVGRMQIRQGPGRPLLVELTSTNGGIKFDPDGRIHIFIAPDQTRELDVKRARYDLIVGYPARNEFARLLKGRVTVDPAVTV